MSAVRPLVTAVDGLHDDCVSLLRDVADQHAAHAPLRSVVIFTIDETGESRVWTSSHTRTLTVGALFTMATQMAQEGGSI